MDNISRIISIFGTSLLVACIFLNFGIVKAEVIYVYEDHDIQLAIENANDGDVIVVADGEYPWSRIDFLGKAITVMSENGPENCIINGWGGIRGVKFENEEGPDSILQGFTITGCTAENGKGGGIYCGENTGPTIINCIISGNTAQGDYPNSAAGGGVFCDRFSSPTLINCQITNNQVIGDYDSYGYGGGIAGFYASPNLMSCLIADNIASCEGGQGHAVGGGGNFMYGSYPVLKSCMIVNNVADNYGGGLCLRYGAKATIQGCTFAGNQGLSGGALYCSSFGDALIRSTILWDDSPQEIHICGEYNGSSVDINFCDIQGGEIGIELSSPYPGILVYGSMNMDADPIFKNPAGHDFHLLSSSPCIDAGETPDWPANYHPSGGERDIDRETRVYDVPWVTFPGRGPVDIGADEARYEIACGDCNCDGAVDVADVVYLINYLFKNGPEPLPFLCVGDANGDGIVQVGDVVYLINYLFKGGETPLGCCQ